MEYDFKSLHPEYGSGAPMWGRLAEFGAPSPRMTVRLTSPLHVLEVEDVSALQLQKVAADKAASVLLYCAVKRRIGGVIEQYAVPWLRQRAHAAADCQHKAVGLEEPLRLYPPAVAARHPGAYLTLQALRRS